MTSGLGATDMIKRWTVAVLAFICVVASHATYYLLSFPGFTFWRALERYLLTQDAFMGLSYGLTVSFTLFALATLLQGQKKGIAGLVGGVSLTGFLYFAGCFLLGCCGSPMLAVYISLFGSKAAGLGKPITFALTLVSVLIGYILLARRSSSACCPDGKCVEEQ